MHPAPIAVPEADVGTTPAPPCDPGRILYQDRHLVVLDKPVGIPVIPGRDGGPSLSSQTGYLVCHRLDRDTSGVLVMARSAAGQRLMSIAFAEGKVEKHYLAVVTAPIVDEVTVEVPLGEWRRGRVQIGQGKACRTTFTRLWSTPDGRNGVHARPTTGRTHQIRAHLCSLGAPILGDIDYGGKPARRIHLHAWRVVLPWPGAADRLVIEAPVPEGFEP